MSRSVWYLALGLSVSFVAACDSAEEDDPVFDRGRPGASGASGKKAGGSGGSAGRAGSGGASGGQKAGGSAGVSGTGGANATGGKSGGAGTTSGTGGSAGAAGGKAGSGGTAGVSGSAGTGGASGKGGSSAGTGGSGAGTGGSTSGTGGSTAGTGGSAAGTGGSTAGTGGSDTAGTGGSETAGTGGSESAGTGGTGGSDPGGPAVVGGQCVLDGMPNCSASCCKAGGDNPFKSDIEGVHSKLKTEHPEWFDGEGHITITEEAYTAAVAEKLQPLIEACVVGGLVGGVSRDEIGIKLSNGKSIHVDVVISDGSTWSGVVYSCEPADFLAASRGVAGGDEFGFGSGAFFGEAEAEGEGSFFAAGVPVLAVDAGADAAAVDADEEAALGDELDGRRRRLGLEELAVDGEV